MDRDSSAVGPGFRRDDPTLKSTSPNSIPPLTYIYLAIIVVTWAGNWPMMKLALGDASPLTFVALRLSGTVALLAPALAAVRTPLLPLAEERAGLLWVGLLQVAGYLLFSIIGLQIVPAGRAIVLAYTMPLWALPIVHFLWPEAPLARAQLLGAAVGFAGLLLFMNPGLIDWGNPLVLVGNGVLLIAAICWALGSCLYRRRVWRSSFWSQTFWQIATSAVVAAALALPSLGDQLHWSARLIGVLAYNWVVTTAVGYFLWNKVLTVLSAAVAGQVLALTPIGGYLLSLAIFGGEITIDVVISIALIAAGIMLTLRGQARRG